MFIATHLTSTASAIEMAPEKFDRPVSAELKAPIENFLRPLAGENLDEALTNARAAPLYGNAEITNKVVVQVRSKRFCLKQPEDGCLTVIGKVSNGVFESEIMLFAGDRMNVWDTVPSMYQLPPIRFFSKTTIVTVALTSRGWIVTPFPQTDPPQ